MAKRKKTVAEPPPVQKPQGKDGKKRTPTSSFDPAAGQDIYEPERILAERLKSGVESPNLSFQHGLALHMIYQKTRCFPTPPSFTLCTVHASWMTI